MALSWIKYSMTIRTGNALTLILLILIIENSSALGNAGFKKCCNRGSLVTQKDGEYSCESVSNDNNYINNGVEFFQRSPSGVWGLPVCQNGVNLNRIKFGDNNLKDNYMRGDFCVDVFIGNSYRKNLSSDNNENGGGDLSTVILFCDNSKQNFKPRKAPTLLKIRRCCPDGEIFKIKNRACLLDGDYSRENGNDIQTTLNLIRNIGDYDFIHSIRGPPKCQDAIVDYELNYTDISVVDGRLQVTASSSHDVVDLLVTEETACLDAGSSPDQLIVRACRGFDYCRSNPCIRKCCEEDEAFVNRGCKKLPPHLTMSKWHSEISEIPKSLNQFIEKKKIMNTTEYGVIIGNPCLYGKFAITPEEGWRILSDGTLHVDGFDISQHHQYCTDLFYNYTQYPEGFYPFKCFDDPRPPTELVKTRFRINAVLGLLSCAFLMITLLVYICLPSLQNLHGKTLMCHVASLLTAYACLAIIGVASPPEDYDVNENSIFSPGDKLCKALGYTMFFAFHSAFFWLNVICFDIWWKFGSLRHSGRTNTKRRDDFKRFISYCIYAWGLPLAFVIIIIIFDTLQFLPTKFQPQMGFAKCWFLPGRGAYGEIIYFTGPVTLQLLVNLIFFILTARRCSLVKAEIQKRVKSNRSNDPRSRAFKDDKSKLILNVKLFVVMGVTWIFEVISYFLKNHIDNFEWSTELFYASDILNCLQGFLIFVLFVVKKKVYSSLKRRFSRGGNRRASNGGIMDPYRVRKTPSSSTILSTFAVSSSP